MQKTFDYCVELLVITGDLIGLSYVEINIWLFCILWPILTVLLITAIVWQKRKLKKTRKELDFTKGKLDAYESLDLYINR